MLLQFQSDLDKNVQRVFQGGICVEQVLVAIWADGLVGAFASLTRASIRNQKALVVACEEHSYLVPFIEPEDHFFLKTVIPS